MTTGGLLTTVLTTVGGGIGGGILTNELTKNVKSKDSNVNQETINNAKAQLLKCRQAWKDLNDVIIVSDGAGGKVIKKGYKISSRDQCVYNGPSGVGPNIITVPKIESVGNGENMAFNSEYDLEYIFNGGNNLGAETGSNGAIEIVSSGGIGSQIDAAEEALNKWKIKDPDAWKPWAVAGGAVAGAAAGIGAGVVADSIIKRTAEIDELKRQDEAVKAWFDNVGTKIQCVVGGITVGSYGDLIELR